MFFIGIAVIALIVLVVRLRAEVRELGERLTQLEVNARQVLTPIVPMTMVAILPVVARPDMPALVSASFAPAPEHFTPVPGLTWWTSQDALTKVGAILVLMAVGWFVSYAVSSGWIGPVGQIALGLVAGVATLVFGLFWMERHAAQGAIFVALGTAIVLLTTFAGRYAYDFFTPISATMLMLGAVSVSAWASVRYVREQLAVASLIMAGIIPLLAHTANPDVFSLFSFLLIVICGTLVTASVVGSRVLVPLALGLVFVWCLPYLNSHAALDQLLVFGFSSLFALIFTAANVFSLIKERTVDYSSYAITAMLTGVYTLLWIKVAAPVEFQVSLYLVWAVLYAFGSWVIARSERQPILAHIYLGMAGVGIAIATAQTFDGPFLVVVAMGEITALLVTLLQMPTRVNLARVVAFLYSIPIVLSIQQITSEAWQSGVLHIDFFVLVFMTLTFFAMAFRFHLHEDTESDVPSTALLIILGTLYTTILIWLVLHATIGGDIATAMALVIYTVIGLALYVGGMKTDDAFARILGMVGIGGVVMHLVLVEVWDLSVGLRIVAFLVIGLLLLSTAFVTKGKRLESAKVDA